jgi:molybdate transport system substrate-binding protein
LRIGQGFLSATMKSVSRQFAGIAVLLALTGCGGTTESRKDSRGQRGTVLILAAASTNDALRELGDAFAKEHGVQVRINADASSKLATQINHDAPGDLFLSASEKWGDFVRDKGFAAQYRLLLGNHLVLIVPKGNPASVTRPEDLANEAVKRLALAAPAVPAGTYARQAFKKLALWDRLESQRKVVSGDDVRTALTYVERGEAEAGVVYSTDARITDQVEVVYEFPESSHDPIRYPLVLLKAGENNEGARRFYDFLQSPPASVVFKKYGFTPLAGP